MLNAAWIPHEMQNVRHVLPMMITDACVALEIDQDNIRAVKWQEWITLPLRPEDDIVHGAKIALRAPTVCVLSSFAKVMRRKPKKNLAGISARDKNICQYSGAYLPPERRSIDHVLPRDRGGSEAWENLVLADKDLNHKKGNRKNSEIGLTLLRQPFEPYLLPSGSFLYPAHIDHERFLYRK